MNDDLTRLPCGVDLLALVQQVSDGLPPEDPGHQAACSHCQRELARIRVVMDDVRGLASEPVPVRPNLARRVMQRLRDEQARVALSATERGRTSINQAIVAQIAHRAALSVPDVMFASARTSDAGGGGSVSLSMHLMLVYGPSIERIVAAVRERVMVDLAELTGVVVDRLDIVVDDIS